MYPKKRSTSYTEYHGVKSTFLQENLKAMTTFYIPVKTRANRHENLDVC